MDILEQADIVLRAWLQSQGEPKSVRELVRKGGPESGNFGHAGRPGEVGGSSSDGGGKTPTGMQRGESLGGPGKARFPGQRGPAGVEKLARKRVLSERERGQYLHVGGAREWVAGDLLNAFRNIADAEGFLKIVSSAEDTIGYTVEGDPYSREDLQWAIDIAQTTGEPKQFFGGR